MRRQMVKFSWDLFWENKTYKKKRSISLFILKFPEFVKTVELRYNKGPRDWQSLFAGTRFGYVEALFSYI